jgi:hypothetical protein
MAQLPLEAKSVQVHLEDFTYPFTWPFFLTFTILVVLAALVLVATLSSKSRENKILSGFSIQETTKMFKYQHEGSRLECAQRNPIPVHVVGHLRTFHAELHPFLLKHYPAIFLLFAYFVHLSKKPVLEFVRYIFVDGWQLLVRDGGDLQ